MMLKVISSGFLWGVGDIAAQYITHTTTRKRLQLSVRAEDFKVNWKRVAITSTFGFAFVGPVGHFLVCFTFPVSFPSGTTCGNGWPYLLGPLDLLVFFTYMGFSTGKNADQVKEDLKRDFVPALMLEGGVWPIVQVANFRYVPVRYQLLYVNIFCLLDSAFLSWVEQQKDAAWKQWLTSFTSFKDR
ncbi:hypothetical protein M0R45_003291 [Rubus argutus]|uniref:Uncharacterized protein n=1 Tax=Rubus argutus TaxID=59490 RepID=A0AAW1YF27_RUBAR